MYLSATPADGLLRPVCGAPDGFRLHELILSSFGSAGLMRRRMSFSRFSSSEVFEQRAVRQLRLYLNGLHKILCGQQCM
jgi:hypothetical protein